MEYRILFGKNLAYFCLMCRYGYNALPFALGSKQFFFLLKLMFYLTIHTNFDVFVLFSINYRWINTENDYNICWFYVIENRPLSKVTADFGYIGPVNKKKKMNNTIHSTKESLKCLRNSWTRRMGAVPILFCYKSTFLTLN